MIVCAAAIANLSQDIGDLYKSFCECDSDLQEMRELTRELNLRFSPLVNQMQTASSQIEGIKATAAV